MEASRGGMMRSQAGTVLVEEIQTRMAVVLKPYWEKRTPRWRGNEDAWGFSYLPLISSEEKGKP
jgi:hypothetical protein